MFDRPSWINSYETIFTSLFGTTFLTIANWLSKNLKDDPITFLGWVIAAAVTTISSYSRIKLNKADEELKLSEARKNNAEAAKLERHLEESEEKLKDFDCADEGCQYKVFYHNIKPLLKATETSEF